MKNKTALIIITFGLIIGIAIIFIGGSKENNNTNNSNRPQGRAFEENPYYIIHKRHYVV